MTPEEEGEIIHQRLIDRINRDTERRLGPLEELGFTTQTEDFYTNMDNKLPNLDVNFKVITIPLGGSNKMTIFEKIFDALKKIIQSLATFLAPFVDSLMSEVGKQVLAVAIETIQQIGADNTILSNSDKRAAYLKAMGEKLATMGITATETFLLNALQAAYTQLYPEKATASMITDTSDIVSPKNA